MAEAAAQGTCTFSVPERTYDRAPLIHFMRIMLLAIDLQIRDWRNFFLAYEIGNVDRLKKKKFSAA